MARNKVLTQSKPAKHKGTNHGNHGKPGKSGRKPNVYQIFKRRLELQKVQDAEEAFSFVVGVMHDRTEATKLRVICAIEIMDRIWGRSVQPVDVRKLSDDDLIARFAHFAERIGIVPIGVGATWADQFLQRRLESGTVDSTSGAVDPRTLLHPRDSGTDPVGPLPESSTSGSTEPR